MMKKLLIMATALVVSLNAQAGLNWGSVSSGPILDQNGDPVPTSFTINPLEGAFAQLIRILAGVTPYDFVNSGSGISVGNEVVVDTMYAGLHDDLSEPGTFAFTPSTILNASSFNGTYYVRVFNTPQSTINDWNLGVAAPIPQGATHYFQSGTYAYSHNETEPSTFDFGTGQTLNVVPEPGTLLLVAAGMGVLAFRRKRIA